MIDTVWALDPDVAHLNHGSFGATPRHVLECQHELRADMERNLVRFIDERYQPAIESARTKLAAFLSGDPAGLVPTRNATEASNAVLASLDAELRGKTIVTTSHMYSSLAATVDETARRVGATVRRVELPFPVEEGDDLAAPVLDAIDDSTGLVVIDHVTSPTGLVFPVADVVAACEPEVPVLVDGAHAPGMVPLAIDALNASFYAGNCHKWLCAPKGAGFLWGAERHRSKLRPATISHGMAGGYPHSGSAYHARFDWTGTDDRTAWMVVPDAIDLMASLSPDGWHGVMAANRRLALWARARFDEELGIGHGAPETMIGAMVALPPMDLGDQSALKRWLRDQHRIEIALTPWGDHTVVRASAQLYNTPDDYHRLATALTAWRKGP